MARMNLRESCGERRWERVSAEQLMGCRMDEMDRPEHKIEELAAIVGRLMDCLPLTDEQCVQVIGSYRWELAEKGDA